MSGGVRGVTAQQLETIFNRTFEHSEHTVLQGGAREPYYVPGAPHRIFFREDFARSALHEISHWCVAGEGRRRLPDYGYWYSPEGRNHAQQAAFFAVEARPQAIEAIFCAVCGLEFSPSIDNISASISGDETSAFSTRVQAWQSRFEGVGLPVRAARFVLALSQEQGWQSATGRIAS